MAYFYEVSLKQSYNKINKSMTIYIQKNAGTYIIAVPAYTKYLN